jgi:dihydropteroate synthase
VTAVDPKGAHNRPRTWRLDGERTLSLDTPRIMAVLNVTPDSFADGGRHDDPRRALARARELVRQGAAILDIGGESTRPGAERVAPREQIARVLPVLRAIRDAGIATPISIDTTRAEVAEAAIDAGASIVNDVSGGEESADMLDLAARRGVGLVLMHRLRPPDADRFSHEYDSGGPAYSAGVAAAVIDYLRERRDAAERAGVERSRICLDPGLGFGKTVSQNYQLIAATPDLLGLGSPVLAAASRKSFTAATPALGAEDPHDPAAPPPPDERLPGSIAITVLQQGLGLRLFRVHDPAAHLQALRAAAALHAAQSALAAGA